jgi:hypothetical protein
VKWFHLAVPRDTKLPKFLAPQVPVLTAEPPTGPGWIHEIKHDGFRTLIRIADKDVRCPHAQRPAILAFYKMDRGPIPKP